MNIQPVALVVEDEDDITTLLDFSLRKAGFAVTCVKNLSEACAQVKKALPDVVVLDWMLPDGEGIAWLNTVRADARTARLPVLMLTARAQEIDKLKGLELGADDYITKPFEPTELVARVEAVLRRCGKAQGTLAAFDVVLDPAARRVTRSGTPLHLTPREFDLLEVLLRNRGIVLYREVLYERVWGLDAEYDSRTLDLHIQRLRKKLGWKNEIRTVFRVGYVLERGE